MLYDCRSDKFVPGVTLWNKSDLEKDISVQAQPHTEYSLETSSSLADKSKALDINVSLRGSFACGLVEVGGSAKYLNNSSFSKNQVRVTLNYFMTTVFKQLTMSQLSRNNVTYEEVFRQGTATHVITAILYGARAFMVFDRDVSNNESVQTIANHLKTSVSKIPALTFGEDGSVDLSDKEKNEAEKIRCTFHGDFRLPNLPVQYLTALDVYKKLPTFLGEDGEHAVPITMWLYPLSLLDSSAARLVHEISTDLVTQVECLLDFLSESELMCDNLLSNSTVKSFSSLEKKISKFKTSIGRYKQNFQRKLGEILPSIRAGTEKETSLYEMLETHGMSPFSQHELEAWLCSLQKDITLIESLINDMEDKNVSLFTKNMNIIQDLILKPDIEYIVSFNFKVLNNDSKKLNTMENYFKPGDPKSVRSTDMENRAENSDDWIHSQMGLDKIRLKRNLFLDFACSNQQNKATKFAVACERSQQRECISILLYCKGQLCSSDFEPPSVPEVPKVVKVLNDSAEIELSLPLYGSKETVKYLVQFREQTRGEWRSQMTTDDEKHFILKDLRKSTQYEVRYAAVCEAGVGPSSKVISIHTEDTGLASCSCEHLETINLSGKNITPDIMEVLALTLHLYRHVWLWSCHLTSTCCSALSSALSAPHSRLTELDLSGNNNMEDSGVNQLCEGLRSENCKLEKLNLSDCGVTYRCCSALSSVLSSPNSQLTELNLNNKSSLMVGGNNNNIGDPGVNQLCEGLRSENCKLEKLSLSHCGLTTTCCSALSSALSAPHTRLTELELSWNIMEDSGVVQLCEGLRSENCKLEKLNLSNCHLTSRCCSSLSSVLSSPHSQLTELKLKSNNLGDSGACQLCEGLRTPNCKLEILWLSGNEISENKKKNLRSLQEKLNRTGRQTYIYTGEDWTC
uniref:Fibronectin type-III domain-containing protein n=1 Tax=Erpetoichthys calabaricus TaxID=27687 RepID=A0A8C4TAZ0_ERPCA